MFLRTWKSTITSHIQDVAFDATTSNSIQDGGALVVNILIFDLRVQLQHCTYQRKTLLFALVKVSTFICKREISGLSSPLRKTPFMISRHNTGGRQNTNNLAEVSYKNPKLKYNPKPNLNCYDYFRNNG